MSENENNDNLDSILADERESEPRLHHYRLAHQLIPNLLFKRTQELVGMIFSGQRNELIRRLVISLQAGNHTEEVIDFSEENIHSYPTIIGGCPSVILQFPPPKFYTEAYFAAVALKNPDLSQVHYFTLEYGWDPVEDRGTSFLCGWDRDGVHLHYHDVGNEPSPTDFVKAIKQVLT